MNNKQGYHRFEGFSVEIFWAETMWHNIVKKEIAPGWYWWACYPGCLPDGEHVGPFGTSAEAYQDAVGN